MHTNTVTLARVALSNCKVSKHAVWRFIRYMFYLLHHLDFFTVRYRSRIKKQTTDYRP